MKRKRPQSLNSVQMIDIRHHVIRIEKPSLICMRASFKCKPIPGIAD